MIRATKAAIWIAVLAGAAAGAYAYRAELAPLYTEIYLRISDMVTRPCSRPLAYRLKQVDKGFGVSRDFVLGALRDAEAIWEGPLGRELFQYDPEDARMDVSLIYDYRQEASSKLQSLGISVDSSKETYDALKRRYDALKSQYSTLKTRYEADVRAFESSNKAYQSTVSYWNGRGGAPKREYDSIQAERQKLESQLAALRSEQAQVNSSADELNALAVTINRLAGSLNLAVERYNTVGQSLGESFEEGLYHTDGFSKTIDIYEFKDRASLVRVLAHELGHSLDLDHVDDPKAIMYSYNQSSNTELTAADLAELGSKCPVK